MVRGPTEVVYQLRLPEGALARVTGAHPALRVLCTPVSANGAGYPTRFLFSAAASHLPHAALREALAVHADELTVLRETSDALDLVGTLNDAARRTIDGTLGEATHALGRDVIHRAALIRAGWLHASVIVAQDGPLEEAMARFADILKARGIEARLGRIAAAETERWPVGTYEESLTPKQAEMVRVALALGLYDSPRRCTLDTLAGIFGISKAAAHNRMKGAERKILARYFEG